MYCFRSDTVLAGTSGMVFSRGSGQHSITTQDLLVNEVTLIQFDVSFILLLVNLQK